MDALIPLLREDATLSMPPYDLWLQGPEQHPDVVPRPRQRLPRLAAACRSTANGSPAFGQYRPEPTAAAASPWALQVLEISDGRIAHLNSFLDTERLFPLFGLPARLAA